VDDYRRELLAAELPAVERAVEKRVCEFATGRHLARIGMEKLGLPPREIPRGEDRQPLWPAGCLGSITHAGEMAIAVMAAAGRVRGVGIDLEEADRVTVDLQGRLLTAAERAASAGADPRLPGLIFSAKEATYKAVHPLVGRFIGFHEVEVDVAWRPQTFRLRHVGDHEPNRVMESGEGYFAFFERYVLTLFIIP
jgi:4'-phosphopantetheinyl transferase EntD